jgi:hypothetical protein
LISNLYRKSTLDLLKAFETCLSSILKYICTLLLNKFSKLRWTSIIKSMKFLDSKILAPINFQLPWVFCIQCLDTEGSQISLKVIWRKIRRYWTLSAIWEHKLIQLKIVILRWLNSDISAHLTILPSLCIIQIMGTRFCERNL